MAIILYKKGIKIETDVDLDKSLKSINVILEKNKLLTMSTINEDNLPHVNCAYYVYDDEFNLYIWTEVTSKHCKNIEKSSDVAISIADSNQKWGSKLQGLQINAKAYPVSVFKMLKPANLYIQRFSLVTKFVSKPSDFAKFDSKIYKLEMQKIKILDEKTFGKEEFKEIEIKR